ncbi:MAG: CoA-binding protein [Bacteroidetes bacterium]|nr:CoA-binding protein [Bacteroidota bacterium]
MIADYLHSNGYKVAGVNPAISIAGEIPVYASLKDVPFQIDIINVFRKSEFIPELVEEILSVNPKCLWLQLGIVNDETMDIMAKNNIQGVQNRCIMVDHRRCI